MINASVLVLNRSFFPIHICSLRRAVSLLYQGLAKAVDDQYQLFDFPSWGALSVHHQGEAIGLVSGVMRVPRVILLVAFDRLPKRHVRFSRYNIYTRDGNNCQYCGKKFSRSELNLDHIIPRSLGGRSTWDNVVCSCHACNRRKGGKTPEKAGMKLLRRPAKPKWTPFLQGLLGGVRHKEWLPFLSTVDLTYWNVELKD